MIGAFILRLLSIEEGGGEKEDQVVPIVWREASEYKTDSQFVEYGGANSALLEALRGFPCSRRCIPENNRNTLSWLERRISLFLWR